MKTRSYGTLLRVMAVCSVATACGPNVLTVAVDESNSPVLKIAAGLDFSCALMSTNELTCWGDNYVGELGLGDTNNRGDKPGEMGDNLGSVDLGKGRHAVAVAATGRYIGPDAHGCAILDDGHIKCWGCNEFGQLGLGDTNNRGDQPGEMGDNLPAVDLGTGAVEQIAVGTDSACAQLDSHQVKCWGYNGGGELGLGNTSNHGDSPGQMGDNLPTIDLGTGRSAAAITAGVDYACVLLDTGQLKCWGSNYAGVLGLGDTNNRGDEPGEMGDNLPTVDLGSNRTAVAIAAGSFPTCALLDNGQVKCWGYNEYGALGLGDTNSRGDEPGEMGDNLPAVDLGAGRRAVAIAASDHTCALLDDGSLKCWGYNPAGELGLGDTNSRGDEPGEMGDNLPAVDLGTNLRAIAVACGASHTCALLADGGVKCWGSNYAGALGLGDTRNRGDASGQMGNALPRVELGP